MNNELLRHTLSTIKYRFNKSMCNYNEEFGEFTLGKGSRTPTEILNHMFQVASATRKLMEGKRPEHNQVTHLNMDSEIERFLSELKRIDHFLMKQELDIEYSKKLIQGPFSDLLTHIGQIAILQRITGNPINREEYSVANIKTGMS